MIGIGVRVVFIPTLAGTTESACIVEAEWHLMAMTAKSSMSGMMIGGCGTLRSLILPGGIIKVIGYE